MPSRWRIELINFGLRAGYNIGYGVPAFLIGAVAFIVAGLFLAPLAIAVHRFVLLGEAADRYRVDLGDPRFVRYVSFLAPWLLLSLFAPRAIVTIVLFFFESSLLSDFALIVFLLLLTNAALKAAARGVIPFILFVISVLVTAVITIFVLAVAASPMVGALIGQMLDIAISLAAMAAAARAVILFPAVAVDAPSATWTNAMADTKGHFWRIVSLWICAIFLPIFIVAALLQTVLFIPVIGLLIAIAVQAVLAAFIVLAMAAGAARLYVEYAQRQGRPLDVAPAGDRRARERQF